MGLTGHKNTGGGIPGSKSKSLGFNMKGSPYSMNQPLHGNAFIGAKVKAEQQNKDSFNVDGKTFPVKKSDSQGPEILGAIGGFLAKKALPAIAKAGAGVAKGLAKGVAEGALKGGKGLVEVGAKSFGSGSDMSSLVKDVPADPKSKTGMGKALSTIGSSISEGVRGLGEGIAGKAGGSPKGFGDKVKNYIGSLDLITNSNTDGSLRKETDKPSTAADSDKNITDLTSNEANSTVPDNSGSIPKTSIGDENTVRASIDQTPKKSIAEQAGVKDYSKLPGMNMEGPLNKLKNMCRR